MTTEIKYIINELKAIRSDLGYIKENMPDKDIFLTAEEKQLLEDSYTHEREGKLVSSKELRKQLKL